MAWQRSMSSRRDASSRCSTNDFDPAIQKSSTDEETMNKRIFLLIASVILIAAPLFAGDAPGTFAVREVAKGVYAVIVPDGSPAVGNAGFVVGDDGVLVIDTLEDPEAARQLLAEIRKLTPLPVRYVVNTHYHFDHVGGNGVFAQAGATVVAHPHVRDWARTENLKLFGASIKPEIKQQIESIALPTVTYENGIEIFLGSRQVVVRYLPGHTGGDSLVSVPDANVVFAGDLLWNKHFPNLIDSSTGLWMETLNRLVADYGAATFIPGHGDISRAADVNVFRNYLATLRTLVARAQEEHKSGDTLVDAVLPQLQQQCGTWGFSRLAKRNIEQTAVELSGKKRLP
jgi:cyclase